MYRLDTRSKVAGSILIVAVILAAVGIPFALRARGSASNEPWPSFTMTYSKESFSGATLTERQVWRIEYPSKHAWRQDLIEDTAQPENVGSWQDWEDPVFTAYDALTGSTTTDRRTGGDLQSPNGFLIPQHPSLLISGRGFQPNTSQPGRTSVTKTMRVPCGAAPARTQACAHAGAVDFAQTTKLVFGTNDIPISQVDSTEGVVTSRYDVISLNIGPTTISTSTASPVATPESTPTAAATPTA